MIAGEPTPKVVVGKVADELYRIAVERVKDYAMFFLDRSGNVASWNDGAEIMKGWRPEEIVGKNFSVFYPREEVANRRPQYELQVATMDGSFEDEGWRLRKDGTMFWANVVITAIKYVDGTLLGFVKITRDLTERKHNEEAIRLAEERQRILLNSVHDHAMFMLDAKGRIMTWNEGAHRLKGHSADEAIGQPFTIFYTPEDVAGKHPAELLEAASRDGQREEEGWRLRKDGTRFWARVTLTALRGSDGKLLGFAKITHRLPDPRPAPDPSTRSGTS